MPIFKIYHVTKYEYDRQVKESMNEVKIFPFQCAEQEVLQHDLNITSNPDVQLFSDYWGNKTGVFNVLPVHKELVVESKLVVRTTAPSQLKINFHSGFEDLQLEVGNNLRMLEVATHSLINAQGEVEDIAKSIYEPGKSVAAVVEACCEYIYKHFKYKKGITTIETTVDEILVHRSGVCQDFAHLMLQILRTLKIPARYVSGYICPNKTGMRGEGATHAWVEAWIPGSGWAGIDPTNNVWVTNTHVKLAVGRNFSDCTPVKGGFKGPARQKLSVYVSVGYEDGNTFEDLNDVQLNGAEAQEQIEQEFAAQQ
jgi:transglutaminase-like putative cysteine protease